MANTSGYDDDKWHSKHQKTQQGKDDSSNAPSHSKNKAITVAGNKKDDSEVLEIQGNSNKVYCIYNNAKFESFLSVEDAMDKHGHLPEGLVLECKAFASDENAEQYVKLKFATDPSVASKHSIKRNFNENPTVVTTPMSPSIAKPNNAFALISPECNKFLSKLASKRNIGSCFSSEVFNTIKDSPESVDLFNNIRHSQTVAQNFWRVQVVKFNNLCTGFQYTGKYTFVGFSLHNNYNDETHWLFKPRTFFKIIENDRKKACFDTILYDLKAARLYNVKTVDEPKFTVLNNNTKISHCILYLIVDNSTSEMGIIELAQQVLAALQVRTIQLAYALFY